MKPKSLLLLLTFTFSTVLFGNALAQVLGCNDFTSLTVTGKSPRIEFINGRIENISITDVHSKGSSSYQMNGTIMTSNPPLGASIINGLCQEYGNQVVGLAFPSLKFCVVAWHGGLPLGKAFIASVVPVSNETCDTNATNAVNITLNTSSQRL